MLCFCFAKYKYVVTRYISTNAKRKLSNNTDITDYFAVDNDIWVGQRAHLALRQKYRYRIDIGKGDIDPPLVKGASGGATV